jgi:hypothetical protein
MAGETMGNLPSTAGPFETAFRFRSVPYFLSPG